MPPPVFATGPCFMVLAAGEEWGLPAHSRLCHYPRPERFALPRILGKVGYQLTEDQIELTVDAIQNPRDPANMSGTLSLELWALTAPYAGGAFDGIPLAGVVIGSLPGQGQQLDLRTTAHRTPIPPGSWFLVLMLREWTLAGYVTRDYANFETLYTGEAPQTSNPVQVTVAPEAFPCGRARSRSSCSSSGYDIPATTPRTKKPTPYSPAKPKIQSDRSTRQRLSIHRAPRTAAPASSGDFGSGSGSNHGSATHSFGRDPANSRWETPETPSDTCCEQCA